MGGWGGGLRGGRRVREGTILYATQSPPGCVCSKVGSDVSHVECRGGGGVGGGGWGGAYKTVLANDNV